MFVCRLYFERVTHLVCTNLPCGTLFNDFYLAHFDFEIEAGNSYLASTTWPAPAPGQPALEAIFALLACTCPRKCTLPNCVCLANGLKCTDMCRLSNCDNRSSDDGESTDEDNDVDDDELDSTEY